ncbi:hypothetical protein A3F05_04120, partial [Candidatus Saccharibacteria bacterium RIFCSPHIGHO2_12_FULL_47_17]
AVVNLAGTTDVAGTHVAVIRIDGAANEMPINGEYANTAGDNAVCDGTGTDDTAPTIGATVSNANSLILNSLHPRTEALANITKDVDYTQQYAVENISGGSASTMVLYSRSNPPTGTDTIAHTLVSARAWVMSVIEIKGATPTFGSNATFTQSSTFFAETRDGHGTVAYNGYLYVVGGERGGTSSSTICKDPGLGGQPNDWECSDVQYAAINADGTLGSWTTNSTYFLTPRHYTHIAAWNGYMYIVGGTTNGNTTYLSDAQYAPINSNGSLGSWSNTTSLPEGRQRFGMVAYNGYLYVAGGKWVSSGSPSAHACNNNVSSSYCNDVLSAPIQSNGQLGSFTRSTTFFQNPRGYVSSAAYNGYIYVTGGYDGVQYAKTDYATISSGTVGSWTRNGVDFTTARGHHATVTYNGYIYIMGGWTGSPTTSVQYGTINSNGSISSWTAGTALGFARESAGFAAANGYIYLTGGFNAADTACNNDTTTYCNNAEYTRINSPAQAAYYERIIDVGSVVNSIDSINFGGIAVCGAELSYAVAGSDGIFGAKTRQAFALPSTNYTISQSSKRYVWVQVKLNDETCGTNSRITDITVNYTSNSPPNTPTLSTPASGATNQSLSPAFTFSTTDAESDYIRYRLYLYQSDCSTAVGASPFTQPDGSPQTGWTGQDAQTSTAYASGTTATYTYQSTLSAGTTYCWKVDARDPGGTNTYGTASTTRLFTTSQVPATPTLNGPSSTNTSRTPQFTLRTTDADSDYLQYFIQLYDAAACGGSQVGSDIDQSVSQTNWSGQNAASSTAYIGNSVIGNSTMATYQYTGTPLNVSQTYSWRAKARDPAGSNAYSSLTACQSFTTAGTETQIKGGTNIRGGTNLR